MSHDPSAQDPLDFVRGMWSSMGFSLPGMMTPTLDVDELDKRITDLKAVEGWLKMNLNMLQMTTQGLELQRATLAAVKAMGQPPKDAASSGDGAQAAPFAAAAAMWPWNFMTMGQPAGAAGGTAAGENPGSGEAPRRKTPSGKK